MESKEFKFNGKTVNFEVNGKNVMVNATEMASVFGKLSKDFLGLEQTEEFIIECCKDDNYYNLLGIKMEVQTENSRYENIVSDQKTDVQEGNSPLENHFEDRKKSFVKVVHGGRNNGTWMHRVLAIKFAAWLKPSFEVWVYTIIDEIIFGSYREDEASYKKIAGIQDEITKKEKELNNHPLLKEIDELKKKAQKEKRKIAKRNEMRISGFRLFSEKEMTGK